MTSLKMALYVGVLSAIYGLLRLTALTGWIQEVAVVVTALILTSVAMDTLRHFMPREVMTDLQGKAVFITGCDTGFGNSVARRLDALGLRVFAGCLFPEGEGARTLQHDCSRQLTVVPCDVTSQSQVDSAVLLVRALLKEDKLHAIVNNAGVFTMSEVEWCTLEMYRRLFEVNCLGAIRVTKAFLPLVRSHGQGGRVVIVASLAGRYTIPGLSAYSVSKHATISFADALRREMAKFGVTVHTVEPGTYRTPILSEEVLEGTVKKDWEAAGEEVRSTYGEQYRDEFKVKFLSELKNARPASKIYEVVDDILDAVVGTEPRCRYVPSVAGTLRSTIMQALPTTVVDSMLQKRTCPPTPPAAVIKQREWRLKNPYTDPKTKQKPFLKRYLSVPMFEKAPLTPTAAPGKPFFGNTGDASGAGIDVAAVPNVSSAATQPLKEEDEGTSATDKKTE
ncbi:short-chain dehydrogenase/reductase family 9C member 7-like isoform X1 [Amphibalanus amphitrite]|uniref:short-chain dehydrogenase/reductase family 9C member 7-like isoform X1 n=1 Tax=Amphibalanus amphitrite TaxID=1232801 RepID=UPI001C92B09C|nr:short-chain dehydrogenase/reductase family 9C member 7-like isoform X1 [Amphibalanus amphitrite]